MKKLFVAAAAAALAVMMGLCSIGCSPKKQYSGLSMYVPDGAPALAVAGLMVSDKEFAKMIDITVVSADTIGTYVAKGTADMVVLPVNAAAKLAGDGEKYKLAAVLTHGNLFLVTKDGETDVAVESPEGLAFLKGKKVGCIQLANVPGLTLKAALKDAGDTGIEYTDNADEVSADKVTLVNVNPSEIPGLLAQGNIDYALAAEPQVSTMTGNADSKVKLVAPLQDCFGGGFPQAVLLVRSSTAKGDEFMTTLLGELEDAAEWVKTHGAEAAAAIAAHCEKDFGTSLKPAALTEKAVTGCNIRVGKAADEKENVKSYLQKIIAVAPSSTEVPEDEFFL